ncbi:MAG: hypothetical protein QE570_19905 [Verrucomicrobiota bacterium]|jgi:hypothetical protein|nr:hypothetical protein [Verrucomicrobiota bacterium]
MKTLTLPAKPSRGVGSRIVSTARAPKLVACGADRKWSREELIAEEAAFLARIGTGSKSAKTSVQLVREGR